VATAYAEALRYFATAGALLPESRWEQHPQLAFELELHWAECEYLSGAMTAAEERLSLLSTRAKTTGDLAAVTCLRVNLYTNLDQLESAVGVGLEYLRRFDGAWSRQATAEDVRHAYDRLWERLGSQAIQALLDLPWMSDSDQRSTMGVLTEMAPPTSFIDENLFRLVVCRMTTLSLDHGNSNGSCLAYVRLGAILSTYFGNYQAGFRFGKLGLDLVEKRGLDGFRSRVYLVFANHVASWTQGLSTCQAFLRRAFETAREAGDQTYAAYSGGTLITNLLATGESLSEVERDAKKSFEFVRKVRFGLIGDCITAQVRFTRTLRGLTSDLTSFGDAEFDELQFVQHVESSPQLAIAACWYWIRKLQASVYANDSISAIAATLKVAPLLWVVPSQFELAEYHFYGALARAAHCDVALVEERAQHFEALTTHHRQLEVWAENCPENFENRAALVGAEIARIEGRELDAEHLYEQAIRSAHTNGFVHNEALANERAAYFYAARSFAKIAQTYLRDARYCYLRWGADGKVRQLDDLYPHLKEEKPGAGPTSTILAPVEHLDVATVIKVSQAVSGEIVLEKLIDTLMRIAIEHAGAERGLLILVRGDGYRIVAEATTSGDAVAVNLRQATVTPEDLPESILHYVVRTKESVLLHDALRESPFSADEYIHRHHARSILCLPLIKQAKLIAVLYLENNLASQVFTSARMTILKLLVSEAAVSLENTRLYGELQEREAKVRRLIDSNIIGICTWGLNRRITGANEAFLRIVGYAREDLLSGRLGWRDLTPAEWHDADARCRAELKATGVGQPYEKEYFHRSGSRVPVLVGAANFEGSQHEGVAFVVDLTDLKRVERAARESERRYREIEIGLAHANRVATMGQLSASIAHEVNQPIGAAVTNAHVALRWLDAEPQNLEKVRQALRRVVKNGDRAGDVINRIRGFIKKAPPQKSSLDINQAILEVIALTSNEAAKHNISVQTQFVENLPLVEGDRVQLQQVVLNLIMNAVEAMSGLSEGPRELLISTAKNEPDGVLVAVRDAGQGLMPTDLDRVFEPFYTTKSEGLGIGLSICRSIIEAHEGRMWATANEPRGAIFKFTLPSRAPLDQTLPRAR
jgi:PAS domain S-box-containing protein